MGPVNTLFGRDAERNQRILQGCNEILERWWNDHGVHTGDLGPRPECQAVKPQPDIARFDDVDRRLKLGNLLLREIADKNQRYMPASAIKRTPLDR